MNDSENKRRFEKFHGFIAAAVLVFLPALLVLLNAAKLHYPTAQWDGWALDAALAIRGGTFAQTPYLVHTPLYLYLLSFFQQLFHGGFIEGARIFGFACYLITGWLVFGLSMRVVPEGGKLTAGLLGAALYFTSPLAVQGALLIDLGDTSVVPLAATAYAYLLARGGSGILSGVLLTSAFALNLWAKLIHSFFFVIAALADALVNGKDARSGRHLRLIGAGIFFFLATWMIYAFTSLKAGDHWKPMEYLVKEMLFNYQRQDLAVDLGKVFASRLHNGFRVMLWIWPPLLLWGISILKRGLGPHPERYFNYFILIFLAAAVVSKGVSNGFPKYHSAVLPLLCALGGAYAAKTLAGLQWGRLLPRAAAAVAVVWFLIFFAGDPFYSFNYGFKMAIINGSGMAETALRLVVELLSVPVAILLLFYAVRRFFDSQTAAIFSLLAAGLVWQTAVGYCQARGDYFTTYGYGTTGKAAAVAYIKRNIGKGVVFGPNEFGWEFREAGVRFLNVSDFCQMNESCVLGILRDRRTDFFVFGPASNTVRQVGDFLGFTADKVGRKFSVIKKGDFWIYVFHKPRN
ncbi:MAG: hypothetical protein A2270_02245 [Elusimicrobia bacterium RIFOXYA12_FULL_51_18]|nr:MAG: hypothetical protein A2270_02245 [Elusimicrobia bacterium RIFOXYA12_FULL_51_18]OGS28338.1 MAG: hypothetical protein A2218_00095 [Elusimicrobia bacterium RIFOXYA2_FULL_53_38]